MLSLALDAASVGSNGETRQRDPSILFVYEAHMLHIGLWPRQRAGGLVQRCDGEHRTPGSHNRHNSCCSHLRRDPGSGAPPAPSMGATYSVQWRLIWPREQILMILEKR